MMLRRSGSGFTLIELLVVIAIIAILAAILFPVFAKARASSRRSKCLAQQHQLQVALAQYQEDWRYYPPPPAFNGYTYFGGFSALYDEYITDYSAMICPTDHAVNGKNPRDVGYCSYNGLIVWHFQASAAAPLGWAFMPIAADGVNPGNAGAAGDPSVSCMRLYNWGGYNDYGFDVSYWGAAKWQYYMNPLYDPMPSYVRSWRQYRRLNNNKAPDSTIVTHCPHHRVDYGDARTTHRDPMTRLGGAQSVASVSGMDKIIAPYGAADWRIQK